MKEHMKVIVLAGGKGEGLWPLSRKDYPKQFMEVKGKSFFLQTIERCLLVAKPQDIYVATARDYFFYVRNVLTDFSVAEKNIIVEPVSRNTAACVLYAVLRLVRREKAADEDIILLSPSDTHIREGRKFADMVKAAVPFAKKGHIVAFGAEALTPDTEYGYIRKGSSVKTRTCGNADVFSVKSFVEKPDEARAKKLLDSGEWYWNTGILLFSVKTMLGAYRKLEPKMFNVLSNADFDDSGSLAKAMTSVPAISIDRAIMEKCPKCLVMPAAFRLLDVGDWNIFHMMCDKDKDGNVVIGDVVQSDTAGSLIVSEKNLVCCSGLKDTAVICTDDVTFVADRKHVPRVKDIVAQLNQMRRPEARERTTSHRPWGSYTVLETGPRYKIKKLVVKPGESLSLQMHKRRSEHWVVIRGIARVLIGEETVLLQEGESTFVPVETAHQLSNPGKQSLEMIEVQMGDYVGEDDIVRFEDKYGRDRI
jgi:mannose-1-phosphate guanylyltransferase / mannose-6-phosphate isomerase